MWDNAYCIHEFDGDFVPFRDILTLCREAGNPDMVYEFASTSKVTLPGAGFSVMATSEANQVYLQKLIGIQTISYDKVNSLRHVRYLKDKAHTLELMKKHAAILNPKFQCVLRHLDTEIAPLGIASWQRPKGGYFVSVNTAPGLAKRTLALCKEAGVVMTSAGATFPYGRDPRLNGYPYKIAEMMAHLDGTAYITRQSVHTPANVRKCKRALRKAFETAMAGKGFSLVEVVSTCNSGWKMSPVAANEWLAQNMLPYYPLGDIKSNE